MSEQKEACKVDFYNHENTVMHLNWANRRMLIALICVCVTFIITIIVFVTGYTTREKNWLDLVSNMKRTTIAEVADETKTGP